ncbi:MAG: hypothetical protein FWC03_07015 [Treponema sp.]|nr:hypothetical protein [Treponema sp.]
MYQIDEILALTDENQRLVNLNLLYQIRKFRQGGIKGLYDKLDKCFKNTGHMSSIDYEAMRKAIGRDFNQLCKLANNPNKLHSWLEKRKDSGKLQIRISDNHFLLNNILMILEIPFNELFNKDKLPGHAEAFLNDDELSVDDEEAMQDKYFLREINSKLDTILYKYAGEKIRKTYMERFNDFFQYINFLRNTFLLSSFKPEKSGFSCGLDNNRNRTRTASEIYMYDFWFISFFMNTMMHKKYSIQKMFVDFTNNTNYNLNFRRMISPLFMIGMLLQLLINFINSGKKNKKSIFRLVEGSSFDFFDKGNFDNDKVLASANSAYRKTTDSIQFMLENIIIPNNETCIKYEIIFVNFINNTFDLFSSVMPILERPINDISNTKEMEDKIRNLFTPGYYVTFCIRLEQLKYLTKYIEIIEEAQIGLAEFFRGNVDVMDIKEQS